MNQKLNPSTFFIIGISIIFRLDITIQLIFITIRYLIYYIFIYIYKRHLQFV